MIYLITGLPGASKTLNTIKYVSEEKLFQNRPVFYYNIRELTLPWKELSKEEVKNWYDLPEGSVIIIDECQEFFPAVTRKQGEEVPRIISQMNTHRHKGFDLILITQHPMLLDTAVRRVVGNHRHFERVFGFRRAKCLEFQKCVTDLEDFHKRKEAQIKQFKLDKKYFNVYKSAEIHTHKPKIPKKLYFIAATIAGIVILGFFMANRISDRFEPTDTIYEMQNQNPELPLGLGSTVNKNSKDSGFPLDPKEYEKVYKPRIEGLAYTAPVYDSLTEPKTFPKPVCVLSNSRKKCQCYTQQATRMQTTYEVCESIVKNGWFDFTKEEEDIQNSQAVDVTPSIKELAKAGRSEPLTIGPRVISSSQ
jgi:zona occludens toxin